MTRIEAAIVRHLSECAKAALNSGSDFNQGVVRGLEIAAAQVEHGHYRKLAAQPTQADEEMW